MNTARALFIVFMLAVGAREVTLAQPPGMPGAPEQAPIDGGLSIVALAGAGYGLRKIMKRSKSTIDN